MQIAPNRAPVLIVEDETTVLSTLKVTLEHEQFDVVGCLSAREALALLPGREFAVIISDQMMPGMTGLEFLGECARICPYSSRILLTGFIDLAEIIAATARGEICRVIAKPWMRVEVISAVRDAVHRHRLMVWNHQLQAETLRLGKKLSRACRLLKRQAAKTG